MSEFVEGYKPVSIPTDNSFIEQWYKWVRARVNKEFHFGKNERGPDAAQRVFVRLLQKEFTARWFFKHLKDDLIDRSEAEYVLGLNPGSLAYIAPPLFDVDGEPILVAGKGGKMVQKRLGPAILPNGKENKRSWAHSLWRIDDLLRYAKFDHGRFFYSIQNHTIDSDRVLSLLAYPAGDYTKLQALWRQGFLLPAELTEHQGCPRKRRSGMDPKECPECHRGLSLLRSKGVTLDMTTFKPWTDPELIPHIQKMRWNDSQLISIFVDKDGQRRERNFLRRWRGYNMVTTTPRTIMRPVLNAQTQPQPIDAGLLKYASILITNEVSNEFKSLGRTDDISRMSCNNGLSPEFGDMESLAFDADSEDGSPRIIADHAAIEKFTEVENQTDITALLKQSTITPDELAAIEALDILGQAARDYSRQINIPVTKVHKLHLSGLRKLKSARVGEAHADRVLHEVCERYSCTEDQVLGDDRFGDPVKARNELFGSLARDGMTEDDMAAHFDYPREKITAAVSRDARARQ